MILNFNPRAPCGARRYTPNDSQYNDHKISTHAPLAGRDYQVIYADGAKKISTHAPLAGRDTGCNRVSNCEVEFQPTRPLRGATGCQPGKTIAQKGISTHAPLAGRDLRSSSGSSKSRHFNPRAG